MNSLSHEQSKMIEWATTRSDQTGDHICFCQTCNVMEKVTGLANVVKFINVHAGHKTCTRTYTNVN